MGLLRLSPNFLHKLLAKEMGLFRKWGFCGLRRPADYFWEGCKGLSCKTKLLKVMCKCLFFWSEIELFELFWTLLAVSSARPSLYNLHLTFEWFPISPKLIYILSKHFEIKLLEAFPRPKKTRSHSFLLSTAGESKKTLKDSKLNFFQNCVHVSPQWVWKLELHEPWEQKVQLEASATGHRSAVVCLSLL